MTDRKNTYANYEAFLVHALELGYVTPLMHGFKDSEKRVLFVTHSIDWDLTSAARLAEIENRVGVKANYFVRLHAPYNPLCFRNLFLLKKILGLGHEIGLHNENMDLARITGISEEEALRRDKLILETALGITVYGVTGHRDLIGDSNWSYWKTRDPKEFGFEYEAYRFSEGCEYITDSQAVSDITMKTNTLARLYAAVDQGRMVYAGLHPFYWFETDYLIDSERAW